ncbi:MULTISPECIES: sensor domain-containing diguanylate cyclase [unclassified Paraburkholderia]|uniref:sensor domain-containing diguanylate cyclase n=1 Tax=unclassified Paraburkholderia TaxID=2615204 RepID=UPI0017CDE44F|nr:MULTISPECIES: sensor domain-containing diguanylate cyclase [unclassified Paraburkholderia]MBB5442371.1 diguanylate cyclase (GGDEF)-like protein [Paraburkholderia sp. WSM4177]MBB5482821.1 diguanylate cyclase (GGDEF)-like protein [Paraburkholderia sp. WSM4180]
MQLAHSNDRLASRMPVDSTAAGEPEVESSVIEWLLHDDQVMRECFTHAAEILKSVTGAAITAIVLLDEEHQHYRAEVGMAMPLVTRARSLADYAVRDADLFVIEDAHNDSRFGECMLVKRHPFVRFYAAIALRAPNGEIVGALCAMDPAPGRLDAGRRGVFYHLRAMIENDLKMRTATAIDPLTQLYNRRFLLETIARRWKEARDGDVMGSVVVDVDWFKQYNDTYGHQAGDHCLCLVASVMQAAADSERIVVGRMGGEEFGMLILEAQPSVLEDTLETLRQRVADLAIEHRASPLGVVTVSIGASLTLISDLSRPAHRDGFASADRALYRSKHKGRNLVTMA